MLECTSCGGTGAKGGMRLACPDCRGKGWMLMVECPGCGGSGFDTPGTGYDSVCGTCGGTKLIHKPRIKRIPIKLKKWKKPPKHVLSDWIVCRVRDRHERSASMWIRKTNKEAETFIPWVELPGSRGKQEALFPGFVFVRNPSWLTLKFTPGVLSVLATDAGPSFVPLRDMRTLLRACDRDGVLKTESETYAVGDNLRAQSGTFKNVWGVYIGDGSKRGRVRILYQILSRDIEVEHDRRDVTIAPLLGHDKQEPIASTDWRGVRSAPKAKKAPS